MEDNLLPAVFVLLAATVALVPLAKAAGLGTVLGYVAAGVLIGPYGLRLVSDTETIHTVAEFGIVMMLFLIGLELQPRELWHMRHKVLLLGLPQLLITALVLGAVVYFAGLSWQAATVLGLALAMSSTAIAMQSVTQRAIARTETGRSSLAILLIQDVAAIPVLAIIPLLASVAGTSALGAEVAEAIEDPLNWLDGLVIVGAFVGTILASRYLVRPVMDFVARTGVREAFTAFGLALVIGAALVTQYIGLSPALGAFLGGVLLADSEYRHELESNLEPFKGLLLGLFFISVGMSIAFSVAVEQPLQVLALVVALVGIKVVVLFGLASFAGMQMADRLLLAILLSQAGEFAFVLLQFAASAGVLPIAEEELLTVVVALSMVTTPLLLLAFDKLIAPRFFSAAPAPEDEAIDARQKIIVLGYGRFGQIVTRMLRGQGFQMTLIDDDPDQIATVRRFGVKVFYGDGSRPELLHAAGAAEAQMIVIAVAERDRINAIATLVRRSYPHVVVAARAIDRAHAHELMAMGVTVFERETFRSAIGLGARALVALGHEPEHAQRLASAFEEHDNRLLAESFALRHDEDAYVGFVRRSVDMLNQIMEADARKTGPEAAPAAEDRSAAPPAAENEKGHG